MAGRAENNKVLARNAPNSDQEPQRPRGPDDRPAPPHPDEMNRKTAPGPGGEDSGGEPSKIYDENNTLKVGKEKWCATCHDEVPASSRPGPGFEVVKDNPAAVFECTWGTSSTGGYQDGDYRWHAAGDGSCTGTWTPDLPAADTYNVYAWWKASANRATDAPYTIYYDGGSATVDVNQAVNGNQWNLLGTYPFVAGQSGYVVLNDDANEYVIADAVKFEP